jgi:hypothetical protein
MKLLVSDAQCVADLPPDDQEDDFLAFDIVQNPEVANSQFELSEEIGSKPLDGPGRGSRLVDETGGDRIFQIPPLASRQGTELLLGLPRDRYLKGHREPFQ